MKALNLLLLAKMSEQADVSVFPLYEKYVSNREDAIKIKAREITTINDFVMLMCNQGVNIECFDGFFYSFTIPQISKEFDLLKIDDSKVLDIELKSGSVDLQKIERQLKQNRHYLAHLSLESHLYAYVKETACCYTLDESGLKEIEIEEIAAVMKSFKSFLPEGIENLFKPSHFLISPINNPRQFYDGAYFLTDDQELIKKSIIEKCNTRESHLFLSISGAAGTGKTLLLYDLAKTFAENKKVCIIHCGMLSKGHFELNKLFANLRIIPAKDSLQTDFSQYEYILIDETHRIYVKQFNDIVDKVKSEKKVCIFGSDSKQVLSKREIRNAICKHLNTMKKDNQYQLTEKIRSNREMANFIKKMFNLKTSISKTKFEHIHISAANSLDEAEQFIEYYKEHGYKYIPYTMSRYYSHGLDRFSQKGSNTHAVIGQEFDKVVMTIDNSFFYNENGELSAVVHPNPDYLFKQLLFQGVTRTREHLALIVINNKEVLEKLLGIVTGQIQ